MAKVRRRTRTWRSRQPDEVVVADAGAGREGAELERSAAEFAGIGVVDGEAMTRERGQIPVADGPRLELPFTLGAGPSLPIAPAHPHYRGLQVVAP